MKLAFIALVMLLVISCQKPPEYDVIIRNGNIYDGSGAKSYKADLAISGDTIAAIGDLSKFTGKTEVDANGLAVSPGFINMLSWANESLIEDGRSLSDLMQGVTTEIMGEGWSMGPLNDKMKKEQVEEQGDIKYKINWTSLKGYLDFMEKKGISCNVASFVGSGTVRIYVLGYAYAQRSVYCLWVVCLCCIHSQRADKSW